MVSKRAKLMVSLAQNLLICTEDDIEIGSLEKLNNFVQSDCDGSTLDLICSELEVPTVTPEEQQTTDGGFLKVSSINCDGFRIQQDDENKNTQMIFYQKEVGEFDETSHVASLLDNTKDSQLSQNKLSSDDTYGKNNIDIQHSELQQTDIDFKISPNRNNDGYGKTEMILPVRLQLQESNKNMSKPEESTMC
ncbi:hypothetical protein FQA39_LY01297 [Lamprigera yunnana]|nr:hypothetical protein FQA39_LY01297 [Lamprigera yunnana]